MTNNSPGMIYVGIDPGLGGGIAFLYSDGQVLGTTSMPTSEADVLAWLHDVKPGEGFASIERVHAFPRMGACSAFTFGKGFGALLMALTASDIPFDIVGPKTWQQVMGVVYPKDAKQTEKKNIAKRRAQQLFPHISVTHAIADALLIAEYTRRVVGVRQSSAKGHTQHGEKGRTEKGNAEGAQSRQGEGQAETATREKRQTGCRTQTAKTA